MLNVLQERLKKEGIFNSELSPYLINTINIVTGTVSKSLKLSTAVSELVLFASQFRRYIKLPNNKSKIPINSITVSLAPSGESKDRTVRAIRQALHNGYEIIEKERKKLAINRAIKLAKLDGKEEPEKWENHKDYYKSPAPLFAAMTNPSAYLDHLSNIEQLEIGAGFLYAGEVGSELATNGDMIPSIRLMSELYDVGYKEAKPLKAKENQTPEIKNLPVSALFVGSHENILYDEKIKNIFKVETATKLGRRFHFTFSPEEVQEIDFTSFPDPVQAMLDYERKEKERVNKESEKLSNLVEEVAKCNLNNLRNKDLTLSEETRNIYEIYQRYCTEYSKTIDKRFPLSIVSYKHGYWRALKLAGAFAVLDCSETISKQNIIDAISYIEYIAPDLTKFEEELVKEKYEVFSDYMRLRAENTGKSSITLHVLKKLQFITGTGNPINAMKVLIELASSYDPDGIYKIIDNTIHYEKIIRTDITGASWQEVDNSKIKYAIENNLGKDEISKQKGLVASSVTGGYNYAEVTFEDLAGLLSSDVAFTPFKLKTPNQGAKYNIEKNPHLTKKKILPDGTIIDYPNLGVRGRENIVSGTTWICFDVDDSPLTAEEAHFMLEDINHHIALTSDPNNNKKFRVIIQLDAPVDIDAITWNYFTKSLSEFLMLPIDNLAQSQIMFGYEGRDVLSVTDQSPVEIKNHIMYATSQVAEKTEEKPLTAKEKKAALNSPMTTFEQAFMAKNGEGSRKLYWAARKAHNLGATIEQIEELLYSISEYWDSPMEDYRLQNIIKQVRNF